MIESLNIEPDSSWKKALEAVIDSIIEADFNEDALAQFIDKIRGDNL